MIRLMTSNIWGDYFGNEVAVREDQLFEVYQKYACDVIGIQEVTPLWHSSALMTNMKAAGYLILNDAPVGVDSYNVLFVKGDRFTVRKSGFEQLTHTEDLSKNIQWAVLIDKKTEQRIVVCTTHFEYRGGPQYDEAREFNAEQLVWRMQYLMKRYECVAAFGFGDMNAGLSSSIFKVYEKRGMKQMADLAPTYPAFSTYHGYPVRGEDGRYHGKTTQNLYAMSLDHIVGTAGDYKVLDYQIVTDQAALDATDHSPVFVDLEL
jgi:endonuclease/exonuclease/phosphatase family metal-dependent hydrolase